MPLPLQLSWEAAQTRWKAQIEPVLANPITNPVFLKNISLKTGVNVINHLLGRVQQGWFLVDQQGPSNIYRTAPFNSTTLTLTSAADVVVSIGVF